MTTPTKPPERNVQPMPGMSKRAQREAATKTLHYFSKAVGGKK